MADDVAAVARDVEKVQRFQLLLRLGQRKALFVPAEEVHFAEHEHRHHRAEGGSHRDVYKTGPDVTQRQQHTVGSVGDHQYFPYGIRNGERIWRDVVTLTPQSGHSTMF